MRSAFRFRRRSVLREYTVQEYRPGDLNLGPAGAGRRDRPASQGDRPDQRRATVDGAQQGFRVSQRRACPALVVHRSVITYRSVKPDDAPVRRRLHDLARDRPAFGVKRLHVLLRRDGRRINVKKVRRLYQEEGLQLKPRKRRRRAATLRQPRAPVGAPNERWAMDFMHEVLATGQRVRVFTLIDVHSRECVALEVARSFSGMDVARTLSDGGERRGGCRGSSSATTARSAPQPPSLAGRTGTASSWT
jgi:transposase InsO family protein